MKNRIKKVCHLTSMHDWNDDRIFQRACAGLARRGYEVHLVAMKGEKDSTFDFEQLGVQIHLVETKSGWKRRWYTSKEVVTKALEIKADLYQFHDPDLLPHVKKLLQNSQAKVVYDIHENYAGRFENWGLPAFLGKWFRNYEIKVINKLDGITVVSETMKSLFNSSGTPMEVTRNSTDLERLKDIDLDGIIKKNPPIVITSGSHSHARNCLQTVKAIPEIRRSFDSAFLFQFVGRYLADIDKEMITFAKEHNCETQLQLDGMAPWEENFSRIAAATVGCVFYEDNPNNRVGIPNRLFEYMYCGLPVVVSNFPELRKIVETAQCGVVVDSENPEDIALGIIKLLQNPEQASQMGANGKKAMIEKFGYHVDLDLMEQFYQSL